MMTLMEGSAALGRCGRLVPAMTRCECAEVAFAEVERRTRAAGGNLDLVQAQTGAGLLCTACLPDLREHLAAAGVPVPAPCVASCVPDEVLGGDGEGDGPFLAEAHEPG
jgi:bacterioferritin-associated ferredoxin